MHKVRITMAAAVAACAVCFDVTGNVAAIDWTTAVGGAVDEGAGVAFHDILVNGDFELGDLFAWRVVTSHRPHEWGVRSGTLGSIGLASSDGSFFATPWTSGGNWTPGTVSTLAQTGLLPTGHTGSAAVRFDAIWAYDAIAFDLIWLDASGATLRSDHLGDFGGRAGVGVDSFFDVVDIPTDAAAVTFSASARLTNGSWIDAGFDNAGIVIATPIPEPATALIAMTGLLLLRRSR